jgi:hypothetical protein
MATNWLSNRARKQALYAHLNGATIKVLLLTSDYMPNKDHVFASELSGELTCTGYERKTLASVVISQDDTLDVGKLAATAPVWAALGPASGGPETAYAVFIKWDTDDEHSEIISVKDCVLQTNSGQFTLNPNATYAAYLWIS